MTDFWTYQMDCTETKTKPNEKIAGLYQKEARLLFLGLDNAGKDHSAPHAQGGQSQGERAHFASNSEELIIGKVKFRTFDLGGHQAARQLWRDYFSTVDGIVYIVDALDRERFPEAKKELDGLLTDDSLSKVPILVLGNKIDVPSAASG